MTHGTQYHPRKQFDVTGQTFITSSFTRQSDTDWCVGVACEDAQCSSIADSKTQLFALDFPHSEFLAFLSVSK